MELSRKQEEGLRTAVERYKNNEKYTVISGYAGTGKSTLIKYIVAALNVNPEAVRYVAYTGKAANVLKNKGCPNAMTAHKLIYKTRMLPNGTYEFIPKTKIALQLEGVKIVVVDEVSMLPKKMWDQLCTYDIYILACGDPAQLPPVFDKSDGEGDQNHHLLDKPHVFLDEIMRQAQESEIVRLSMHVREGKPISSFEVSNQEVMIVSRGDVTDSMLNWGDQILCATNRTRNQLNARVRSIKGLNGGPQIGDRIINLHNEWEILSNKDNALTNGVIGTITELTTQTWTYPYWVSKRRLEVPIITLTFTGDEEDEYFNLLAYDLNNFTGTPTLTKEEMAKISRSHSLKYGIPLLAYYGYAITCWKAQGSEYSKIILFDENWPNEPDLKKRFLYTGITRAQSRVVLVKS